MSTNREEKAARSPVRLITTAGDDLPLGGFVLIPEERALILESLAKSARDLVVAREAAVGNVARSHDVETALKSLQEGVDRLAKGWGIP